MSLVGQDANYSVDENATAPSIPYYRTAWYISESNVATSIVCGVGLLAVLGNTCMLVVILKANLGGKGAGRQNFILLIGLVVADSILGLGYFGTQLYSFLCKSVPTMTATNLACALLSTIHVFGTAMGELLMLCIAVERLVAVACSYTTWQRLSTVYTNRLMLACSVALSLLVSGCSFIDLEPNGRPPYTGILAGYGTDFALYWVMVLSGIGYATTAIYLLVLVLFLRKRLNLKKTIQPNPASMQRGNDNAAILNLPSVRSSGETSWEAAKRQNKENQATNFIIVLIACKLLTTQSGYTLDLVNWLLLTDTGVTFARISKWCTVLVCFNTLTNIVVYPWKNNEIRAAFKRMFCRWRIEVKFGFRRPATAANKPSTAREAISQKL